MVVIFYLAIGISLGIGFAVRITMFANGKRPPNATASEEHSAKSLLDHYSIPMIILYVTCLWPTLFFMRD